MTMIPLPSTLEMVLAERAEARGVTVEQLAVAILEKELGLLEEDDTGFASKEIEEAWISEIKRRVDAIDSGRAVLVDGEEALKRLREGIRRRRVAA
jgi:hypothetical protein